MKKAEDAIQAGRAYFGVFYIGIVECRGIID